MKISNKTRQHILYHILCWAGFIIYEISIIAFVAGSYQRIWSYILYYLLNILVFYSCVLFAFPLAFGKRLSPIVLLPVIILTELFLYTCFGLLIKALLGEIYGSSDKTGWLDILRLVYRGGYFLLLAMAYWFPARLIVNRQKLLASQNAYLQSRLNPHLLFNTLHFLHDHTYETAPDASQSILLLSEIMRYSMQEPGPEGKLPLEGEVRQVENYIALNQLRVRNEFALETSFTIDDPQRGFLPLLLLSLVENCFKHGNLYDHSNPAVIAIGLSGNMLVFYSKNVVRPNHSPGSGIGIKNTLLRLENYYPKRYTFSARKTGEDYIVNLSVRL